jgi:hypothetical protein
VTCAVTVLAGYMASRELRPDYVAPGGIGRLCLAIAGSCCVLSAPLLTAQRSSASLKRWFNVRRSVWFRAHIWLGLLAGVLFLCHADFRWGGWLETALWLTFCVTLISGVAGYVMQIILTPLGSEIMTETLPASERSDRRRWTVLSNREGWTVPKSRFLRSTAFEPAIAICRRLERRADAVVERLCGPLDPGPAPEGKVVHQGLRGPLRGTEATPGVAPLLDPFLQERLLTFYRQSLKPYLSRPGHSRQIFTARPTFTLLRALSVSPNVAGEIDKLERLYEMRRRLARREQLHAWLHGWLWVHVPAAVLMILLMCAHALAALGFFPFAPLELPR